MKLRWAVMVVGVLVLSAIPALVLSQTNVPHSFVNGTVVSADDVNENFDAVAANTVPTGALMPFAGQTAPLGWALCDGAEVDRSAQAALFAVVGTSFGEGDGTTTFHLPDMRGRFVRGHDAGSGHDPGSASRVASNPGGDAGDAVGSYQADAFQGHHHNIAVTGANWAWHENTGTEEDVESSGANDDDSRSLSELAAQLTATTPETMSGQGTRRYTNETRPKNVSLNYIIKL